MFAKLKVHQQVFFVSLAAFILLLPGQNDYQTLQLYPQTPQVKAVDELPPLAPYPVFSGEAASYLTAKSAIVIDVASAAVLYQKNPDLELMPASTTKIVTALVALDSYKLDDIITVKEADDSIGHSMELVRGEQITVENLLYGILVESGNDAALALAQAYPDGYQAFVDRMNQKAEDLHADNTAFRNVSGVEQFGHTTTVRDLSIIARVAMQNPTFARMVETKSIIVKSIDGKFVHNLENINELLGVVPGLKGVKTGWTENSGECLVTYTERNGHAIVTVVLGSADRFGESQSLIEWAFTNHRWE